MDYNNHVFVLIFVLFWLLHFLLPLLQLANILLSDQLLNLSQVQILDLCYLCCLSYLFCLNRLMCCYSQNFLQPIYYYLILKNMKSYDLELASQAGFFKMKRNILSLIYQNLDTNYPIYLFLLPNWLTKLNLLFNQTNFGSFFFQIIIQLYPN